MKATSPRTAGHSDATQSLPERRQALREAFEACRAGTLKLFADVGDEMFRTQAHPDFSPVGWHLGHLVYVEARWLLVRCGGLPLPRPEWEFTFDVEGLPKEKRRAIPGKSEVLEYAAGVRERMLDCLERADLDRDERLWRFVLQHECQHSETVTFVKYLCSLPGTAAGFDAGPARPIEWIRVPAGRADVGSDGLDAMDNEAAPKSVVTRACDISRHPVTQAQYRAFMTSGGYDNPEFWTVAGWRWKTGADARGPLYWRDGADDAPVCGVSAHEADAFATWAGCRLPTEFEWEKAARWDPDTGSGRTYPWGMAFPDDIRCNHDRQHDGTCSVTGHPSGRSPLGVEDMLGNVWEWTSSTFASYDGFRPFPYRGYSEAYFDGMHRVLRGGSWATRPWALRPSFRNWYYPEIRQILSGFRLARDVDNEE